MNASGEQAAAERPSRRLRVLTYHRVAEPGSYPDLNPRLISATPEMFEQQMRLIRRRYSAVSMPGVLRALNGAGLPRNAVLITFDDAYIDLADHAMPVLEQLGLPATIFVPTAFPDQPERAFWGDHLHRAFASTTCTRLAGPAGTLDLAGPLERRDSLKRLLDHLKTIPHADAAALVDRIPRELGTEPVTRKSVLDWQALRDLATQRITLAAHTQTHPILTQLPPDEVGRELTGSQRDIEREIGASLPVLCYPNGSHDDRVVSIARDAGFRLAFTTIEGHNDLARDDPLRLRRINITPRTSTHLLRIRLTRWGPALKTLRSRLRG